VHPALVEVVPAAVAAVIQREAKANCQPSEQGASGNLRSRASGRHTQPRPRGRAGAGPRAGGAVPPARRGWPAEA
jgi:hypothetical protein